MSHSKYCFAANFRALDSEGKEAKEDAVFTQQRQANIAEISRVKEKQVKSFGGRKEVCCFLNCIMVCPSPPNEKARIRSIAVLT